VSGYVFFYCGNARNATDSIHYSAVKKLNKFFSVTAIGGTSLPFPQEVRLLPNLLPSVIAHCNACIMELEQFISENVGDCPAKDKGASIADLDFAGAWVPREETVLSPALKPLRLNKDTMPLISIVIPSFNQAGFVRQTLDSIFGQNYPNLEVIVLDPGSTDGTREILQEYSDRINRLIFKPDAGQSDALQRGLNLANGEILTWLCTDDMLAPNALICAAAAFMRHRCDMVVGGCRRIDENGASLGTHYAAMPFDRVINMNWMSMMDVVHQWEAGHFFYQPEVFFTKDIWRRSGGFFHQSAYFAMDYDLWVRMALAGARGVQIKPMLGCSRQQPKQKTRLDGNRIYLPQILFFLKLYKRIISVATCGRPESDCSTVGLNSQQLANGIAFVGKKLNLGCGNRWRTGWVNIDFTSNNEHVIPHNMLNGIPCDDAACAVVYHSHVIEHFTRKDAHAFLTECHRVLRPGGVLRIAFPDLEKIARDYLQLLAELKNGNAAVDADYEWVLLTLLDQMVRNVSGGQMATYFMKDRIENERFIAEYTGKSLSAGLMHSGRQLFLSGQKPEYENFESLPLQVKMMKIGKFRLSGEVHQWMYDTYSLSKLLSQAGFTEIVVRDAFTSSIPYWRDYDLDTEPDGSIYKPESAYIEAIKSPE
jgi:glycosyltransferase involved in cell wall biosynthesis